MALIQWCESQRQAFRAFAKSFKAGDITASQATVTVRCACGCDDSVRIRADKLGLGDVFISNRRANRKQCLAKMPVFRDGGVIRLHRQKGDRMVGVSWVKSTWCRTVKVWFSMMCLRCAAWLS